ncbi:MAG: nuclear transport factor 2 family protein [Solirubrobacteraceae bacterium]
MPTDNLGVVRAGIVAFNRDGPEAILSFTDPQVVLEYQGVLIDQATVHRGREEVRKLLMASWEDFDELHVEIEESLEHGDSVILGLHVRARGKASLVPVDLRPGHVMSLRDGIVFRWRICESYDVALAAAGARDGAPARRRTVRGRDARGSVLASTSDSMLPAGIYRGRTRA